MRLAWAEASGRWTEMGVLSVSMNDQGAGQPVADGASGSSPETSASPASGPVALGKKPWFRGVLVVG